MHAVSAAQRRERLAAARLYLCTGPRQERGDLAEFLTAVLAGGVDVVQLRAKGMSVREVMAVAEVVAAACGQHGALFAVNDSAEVAYATGADLLHVGQRDLPPTLARELVGEDVLIGQSVGTFGEVDAVAHVDYFSAGPVWSQRGRPAGLGIVRHAARVADRAWFASGGIERSTLRILMATGARRIVVGRALTEAADPGAEAAALAAQLREV